MFHIPTTFRVRSCSPFLTPSPSLSLYVSTYHISGQSTCPYQGKFRPRQLAEVPSLQQKSVTKIKPSEHLTCWRICPAEWQRSCSEGENLADYGFSAKAEYNPAGQPPPDGLLPSQCWWLQVSSQSPFTTICPADFPISSPQTWHWPCLPRPGWLPEDPEWGLDSDRTGFPWQRLPFQSGSGSSGRSPNLSKPLVPGSKGKRKKKERRQKDRQTERKTKKRKTRPNIYPPRTVIKIWWRLCI